MGYCYAHLLMNCENRYSAVGGRGWGGRILFVGRCELGVIRCLPRLDSLRAFVDGASVENLQWQKRLQVEAMHGMGLFSLALSLSWSSHRDPNEGFVSAKMSDRSCCCVVSVSKWTVLGFTELVFRRLTATQLSHFPENFGFRRLGQSNLIRGQRKEVLRATFYRKFFPLRTIKPTAIFFLIISTSFSKYFGLLGAVFSFIVVIIIGLD